MFLCSMLIAISDGMEIVQLATNMKMKAESSNNCETITVASMIAFLLTLIIFLLLQDTFVKSLLGTGLKDQNMSLC